jgi:hypothetical protein
MHRGIYQMGHFLSRTHPWNVGTSFAAARLRNATGPQHAHRCLDPEKQNPARLSQPPPNDAAAATHIGKIHGHGVADEAA